MSNDNNSFIKNQMIDDRYCNYARMLKEVSGVPSLLISRPIPPLREIPHVGDPRRERSLQLVHDLERTRSELPLLILAKSEQEIRYKLRRIVIAPSRLIPITRANFIPNTRDPRRVKINEKANYPSWSIGPPTLVENDFVSAEEETCPVLTIDVSDWPRSKHCYIEIIPHECNIARSKLDDWGNEEPDQSIDNGLSNVVSQDQLNESIEVLSIDDKKSVDLKYNANVNEPMLELSTEDFTVEFIDKKDSFLRRLSEEAITFVKPEPVKQQRPLPRLDEDSVDIVDLCDDDDEIVVPKKELKNNFSEYSETKKEKVREVLEVVTLDDDDDDDDDDDIIFDEENSIIASHLNRETEKNNNPFLTDDSTEQVVDFNSKQTPAVLEDYECSSFSHEIQDEQILTLKNFFDKNTNNVALVEICEIENSRENVNIQDKQEILNDSIEAIENTNVINSDNTTENIEEQDDIVREKNYNTNTSILPKIQNISEKQFDVDENCDEQRKENRTLMCDKIQENIVDDCNVSERTENSDAVSDNCDTQETSLILSDNDKQEYLSDNNQIICAKNFEVAKNNQMNDNNMMFGKNISVDSHIRKQEFFINLDASKFTNIVNIVKNLEKIQNNLKLTKLTGEVVREDKFQRIAPNNIAVINSQVITNDDYNTTIGNDKVFQDSAIETVNFHQQNIQGICDVTNQQTSMIVATLNGNRKRKPLSEISATIVIESKRKKKRDPLSSIENLKNQITPCFKTFVNRKRKRDDIIEFSDDRVEQSCESKNNEVPNFQQINSELINRFLLQYIRNYELSLSFLKYFFKDFSNVPLFKFFQVNNYVLHNEKFWINRFNHWHREENHVSIKEVTENSKVEKESLKFLDSSTDDESINSLTQPNKSKDPQIRYNLNYFSNKPMLENVTDKKSENLQENPSNYYNFSFSSTKSNNDDDLKNSIKFKKRHSLPTPVIPGVHNCAKRQRSQSNDLKIILKRDQANQWTSQSTDSNISIKCSLKLSNLDKNNHFTDINSREKSCSTKIDYTQTTHNSKIDIPKIYNTVTEKEVPELDTNDYQNKPTYVDTNNLVAGLSAYLRSRVKKKFSRAKNKVDTEQDSSSKRQKLSDDFSTIKTQNNININLHLDINTSSKQLLPKTSNNLECCNSFDSVNNNQLEIHKEHEVASKLLSNSNDISQRISSQISNKEQIEQNISIDNNLDSNHDNSSDDDSEPRLMIEESENSAHIDYNFNIERNSSDSETPSGNVSSLEQLERNKLKKKFRIMFENSDIGSDVECSTPKLKGNRTEKNTDAAIRLNETNSSTKQLSVNQEIEIKSSEQCIDRINFENIAAVQSDDDNNKATEKYTKQLSVNREIEIKSSKQCIERINFENITTVQSDDDNNKATEKYEKVKENENSILWKTLANSIDLQKNQNEIITNTEIIEKSTVNNEMTNNDNGNLNLLEENHQPNYSHNEEMYPRSNKNSCTNDQVIPGHNIDENLQGGDFEFIESMHSKDSEYSDVEYDLNSNDYSDDDNTDINESSISIANMGKNENSLDNKSTEYTIYETENYKQNNSNEIKDAQKHNLNNMPLFYDECIITDINIQNESLHILTDHDNSDSDVMIVGNDLNHSSDANKKEKNIKCEKFEPTMLKPTSINLNSVIINLDSDGEEISDFDSTVINKEHKKNSECLNNPTDIEINNVDDIVIDKEHNKSTDYISSQTEIKNNTTDKSIDDGMINNNLIESLLSQTVTLTEPPERVSESLNDFSSLTNSNKESMHDNTTSNYLEYRRKIVDDLKDPTVLKKFNMSVEITAPEEMKTEIPEEIENNNEQQILIESLNNIYNNIDENSFISEKQASTQDNYQLVNNIESSQLCNEKSVTGIKIRKDIFIKDLNIFPYDDNIETEQVNETDKCSSQTRNTVENEINQSLENNTAESGVLRCRNIKELLKNPSSLETSPKDIPNNVQNDNLNVKNLADSLNVGTNNAVNVSASNLQYSDQNSDSNNIQLPINSSLNQGANPINPMSAFIPTQNSVVSQLSQPMVDNLNPNLYSEVRLQSNINESVSLPVIRQIRKSASEKNSRSVKSPNNKQNQNPKIIYASSVCSNMFDNSSTVNPVTEEITIFTLTVPRLDQLVIPEPFSINCKTDSEQQIYSKLMSYKNILLKQTYYFLRVLHKLDVRAQNDKEDYMKILEGNGTLLPHVWEFQHATIIVAQCFRAFKQLTTDSYNIIFKALSNSLSEQIKIEQSIPNTDTTLYSLDKAIYHFKKLKKLKMVSPDSENQNPVVIILERYNKKQFDGKNIMTQEQKNILDHQIECYHAILNKDKIQCSQSDVSSRQNIVEKNPVLNALIKDSADNAIPSNKQEIQLSSHTNKVKNKNKFQDCSTVSNSISSTKSVHIITIEDDTKETNNLMLLEDNFSQSCLNCKRKKSEIVCARCKTAVYCTRECQLHNWKEEHYKICKHKLF